MANTRETMGEQACLDALVADTLTSFEDDGITKIGDYCLRGHKALTNVKLGQCKSINFFGLADCTNLTVVDMQGTGTIADSAFRGAEKLTHLVLRGTSKTTLSSTSAFYDTPIATGDGAIYVDESLLSAYKADSNWKDFFITTLDEYPASDFSSITESWSELDAMTQEQISAKYSVGKTKLIDLGTEGKVYAQIAGFGLDSLASGNGSAKVTFIIKSPLITRKRMNPKFSSAAQGTGAIGGWEYCEMRTYLNDTIYAMLPSELRSAIKPVTKYSSNFISGSTYAVDGCITEDKLWLLSHREVFNENTYEQNGPAYTDLITMDSRTKYDQSGTGVAWWLRSAYSASNFRNVNYRGATGSGTASTDYSVIFGFCI